MNSVRGLLRELIERRLWPIAVLLLAAAVAVPIYLGRSSAQDTAATPPAAGLQADAGKASKAAVTIEDPAAGDDRDGSVRNPFKQQHVPKPAAVKPAQAPAASSAGATPATGSTGGTGGDGSVPPVSGSGGSGGSGGSTGSGGSGGSTGSG
ncbi:MAG: hypothetical protein ACXWZZ_08925, partial [Solirubrobacteraceae bacterium]